MMAEPLPPETPHEHARRLAALGLRVVPIAPGQKYPKLEAWQNAATDDLDTIDAWWTQLYRGHGVGIAMGDQPNGDHLFAIDVDQGPGKDGPHELAKLLMRHGTFLPTWESITGSDGSHVIFKAPPGVIVRNQQANGNRIAKGIDVRGQGGQIVVAPTIHPGTKKAYAWRHGRAPWDLRVTVGPEWLVELVCEIEAPSAPIVLPARPVIGSASTGDESPADWLRATWDWRAELERQGWAQQATKPDATWWTRPGKSTRDGHSAVLHGTDGPFVIFTTDVTGGLIGLGTRTKDGSGVTYSPFEWYAAHTHGGDLSNATRALRSAMTPATASAPRSVPANVDPATGEVVARGATEPAPVDTAWLNLPDEFWNARPSLQHIRQAAHARTTCADSVLVVVLARVVTLLPPTLKLPGIVGSPASLNLFGAIVSASGGGKSSSVDVGSELVPITFENILDGVSPGSGEGLVEMYLELVDDVDPDSGKKVRVKRQTKQAAFVFVDEGQSLIAMGERSGATIMPTLRSAWMGAILGQQNASQETNRRLGKHKYRMALIMGFQLEYAATIIADGEGGTPQRFIFMNATDPTIPEDGPEWPGALPLVLPPVIHSGHEFTFDAEVAAGIRKRRHMHATGRVQQDNLNSHADLARMKAAAALAVIDGGRLHVTVDDWELAGMVMRASGAVRGWAIEVARSKVAAERAARTNAVVSQQLTVFDATEQRALVSGARSIARKVSKVAPPVDRTTLNQATASKHRALVSLDQMITHAEENGWIEAVENGWQVGKSVPA